MLRGMGSASNSDLSPQPLAQVTVSECRGLFLLQPMRQQRAHCHYSEQDFSLQCPAWLPPGRAEKGGLACEGFLTRGFLPLSTFSKEEGGTGSQREGRAWAARSELRLRRNLFSSALQDCSSPGQGSGGGRSAGSPERGERYLFMPSYVGCLSWSLYKIWTTDFEKMFHWI